MRLSDLVDYRNLLDEFDLTTVQGEATHKFNAFAHKVINHGLQFNRFSHQIAADGEAIRSAFTAFGDTVDSIRQHLDQLINERKPEQYRESLRWFEFESIYETNDYILNRRLHLTPEDQEELQGRVLRYTDWRLPGLCFRPGMESWVEQLVPLDPLYLVDINTELLAPAVNKFHPDYQRRLRLYTVKEKLNEPLLTQLPNNQFGYVFAYNWFNFKPMQIIEQYLREMLIKLRPGGVMLMTFNDCDYAHGVALAERNFMCYTPGTALAQRAEAIGFDVIHRYKGSGDVAWIELQRPGNIETMRGGQTLAKIMPK